MRGLLWALPIVFTLGSWSNAQVSRQNAPLIDMSHEFVPGEIIYSPEGPATSSLRQDIRALVNADEEQALWPGRIYRLVLPKSADLRSAIETLNRDARIRYAEPNYIVRLENTPNDPSFGGQWGFNNGNDADIDAPEAWDIRTDATPIIVGVIDTGVEYTHSDLAANMWTNSNEIPGNGIDDDGNGWVDDVHGIDSHNNDGDPIDDHGHGTHVSGTIGAVSNNGIGVAGTCWNVRIMGLKFLSASGSGSVSNAIACVNYAAANGASLTNNSWGGGGFSQGLYDAIDLAGNAGLLFIAAAGNSNNNNDGSPFYPATYNLPEVISVASTDSNDNKSSFSSYGATTVDLGAPGSDILSTWIGNSYVAISGTSMATPHVSGVAAMVYADTGSNNALAVKQYVLDGVDVIPSMTGITLTNGRLNYRGTLDLLGPPPPNEPPVADAGSDQSAFVGDTLTFNGSSSSDPNGDSLAYTWDFGDGSPTENGVSVTHAYGAAGSYIVTLTVDDGEFSDADTLNATISDPPPNQAPTADAGADQDANTGSSVNFNGSGSSDPEDDVLTYVWDFGDGSPTESGVSVSHAYAAPGSYVVTLTVDDGEFNDSDTANVTVSDPPPTSLVYMSFISNMNLPGLGTVSDEDIVAYDINSGTFSMVFDGSDVGFPGDLYGFAIVADGILMSPSSAGTIGGVSVDATDVLKFTPTSLGSNTSGTFSMYFDGSDVGLTSSGERLDAVSVTSDGRLVISTRGSFSANGLSGRDEDLIIFNHSSLGVNTSGSFEMLFDGSDVGLSSNSEDVNAAHLTSSGDLILSVLSSFSVSGLSGGDEDAILFAPSSLGSSTSGIFSMFIDGSLIGLSGGDIDGIHMDN